MGAAVVPTYRHDLVTLCCGECGIEFAVPSWWEDSRRKDHKGWYCPNGHCRAFHGETPEQKRIRELEAAVAREKSAKEWAESQKRSADIRRGKAEKALKRVTTRVECGVCPHCQRTFKQLAAHMKSKHADALAGKS